VSDAEPVKSIITPTHTGYRYTPGAAQQKFLRGIEKGKLLGQRCPKCNAVCVPSRGSCARCGVVTDEAVEVSDKGTVTTYCIVRVPSENIDLELPYCCAHILLDGSDMPFFSLLQECAFDSVRMGMRVQAVWKPESEWGPSFENIRYFKPIDEPDVPFEQFKEHL
jgi:uncharacterized OB-fold protein